MNAAARLVHKVLRLSFFVNKAQENSSSFVVLGSSFTKHQAQSTKNKEPAIQLAICWILPTDN